VVQGIWCSDFEVMLSVNLLTGEESLLSLSTYSFSSETENAIPQRKFKCNSVLAAAAIWHFKGRELKVKSTFNHCRLVQLEVNMVVLFH
jgi:hypothetical protein